MAFDSTVISGIPVLSPHGDLLGDRDNDELHAELLRLIETRPKAIILDFKNVSFVVSAALGSLIESNQKAMKFDVRLMLANLPIRVKRLLHFTKLSAYLKDHGSVEEAVATAMGDADNQRDPTSD